MVPLDSAYKVGLAGHVPVTTGLDSICSQRGPYEASISPGRRQGKTGRARFSYLVSAIGQRLSALTIDSISYMVISLDLSPTAGLPYANNLCSSAFTFVGSR